jgi:hypothetical protein
LMCSLALRHGARQVPPPAHLLVKEAPTSFDQDPPKLQRLPYLMGMWQDVWVDPNAWAIGPLAAASHLACGQVGC